MSTLTEFLLSRSSKSWSIENRGFFGGELVEAIWDGKSKVRSGSGLSEFGLLGECDRFRQLLDIPKISWKFKLWTCSSRFAKIWEWSLKVVNEKVRFVVASRNTLVVFFQSAKDWSREKRAWPRYQKDLKAWANEVEETSERRKWRESERCRQMIWQK